MKITVLLLLISTASFAQSEAKFGIKTGVTVPNSIHAGLFVEDKIKNKVSFVAEILYNQKVTIVDTDVLFKDDKGNALPKKELRYALGYVQVPLSLKITTGEDFRPYIMAGLAIGYLISNSDNSRGTPAYPIVPNNTEYSYQGSLGFEYKPIFMELRYNASFNSAITIDVPGAKESYYNRNMMVSVGVKF